MPVKERRGHWKLTYPWDKMEVGDSFSVEIEKRTSIKSLVRYMNQKNDGRGFDWADIHENGNEYVRVWRIK